MEFEDSADELRLLAIGDVHLGTRPSSLPDDLDEWGVDPRSLTPESALQGAVDLAIARRVDAVLFAGDVVESANARFEALRPLEAAVKRLLDAGIRVLGVAGNHDVEALPRLADWIEGFELIGRGGKWQTCVIERAGRPAAEIIGWSFPVRQVRASPVSELIRNPVATTHPGIPRIGLLHGDLDASSGPYAPFTSGQLDEAGADAWLLGHIHKPSLSDAAGRGPRGYLGSLVGLDPGERGAHGPWLIRVDAEARVFAEQCAIAPLRWDVVTCPVEPDDDPEQVGDRVVTAAVEHARSLHAEASAPGEVPRVLGVRVRVTGPVRAHDAIVRAIQAGEWRHANRRVGETLVFVDKVLDGLSLALELEELAKGDDPAAILASKLLLLRHPGDERRALLEAARAHAATLAEDARWSPLTEMREAGDPLGDEVLADRLIRSGTAALSELLAQRETRSGASS